MRWTLIAAAFAPGCIPLGPSDDEIMAQAMAKHETDLSAKKEKQREQLEGAKRRHQEREKERLQEEELERWRSETAMTCSRTMRRDHCSSPPAAASVEDIKSCSEECGRAIESSFEAVFVAAIHECIEARTAGDMKARCQVEIPEHADPSGDGSGIDPEKLSPLVQECTDECHRLAAEYAAQAEANEAAVDNVLAYKRCMVQLDSTLEARRYAIYDRVLYRDFLRRANAKCRAAHGCEEVEASSELVCSYGD